MEPGIRYGLLVLFGYSPQLVIMSVVKPQNWMVYSVQSRISVFEPTQKLGGRSKEKETELIQII